MSTTTLPETLTGTYQLDPSHTHIGFVARHAMVTKVRGSFNEVRGTGSFDADDPSASRVEVTIDVASVDTRSADRDAHLRSDDFFATDTYPTMTFASTAIEQVAADRYRVTGDLTIKDLSRPVTFEVELTGPAIDPWGNLRLGLTGSTTVNRRDWGLAWNAALEAGGVLVSEKVTLELEASAIRVDA